LNQLGIGTWFYSGNDVITYNDNYVFGTLGITAVVPPVTFAGQLNTAFDTNGGTGFNGLTNTVIKQPDGKFIIGGGFTSFNGNPAVYIVRLNADGSYDNTFASASGFNGAVEGLALQSDGKIIAVGNFTNYAGNPSNYIARINSNGTFDATFVTAGGFNGTALDVQIQTDGKIVVAGVFNLYAGNSAVGIVRINTNGSYDATFNTVIGTGVGNGQALVIQPDGKIILGGGFGTYNGIPANRIVRINTNGSYDGTFNTTVGANNTVFALAIQTDGKIIAGGSFTQYDGNISDYLVRINTNGSYDATYPVATGFDNTVLAIAIQSNGKIIAAGSFGDYQGTTVLGIARINTNATIDTTFVSGAGFSGAPNDINYNSADNTITVGGGFISYDGVITNFLAQIYTVSPA
jgi:uncharacterized delta-60 repeat protein